LLQSRATARAGPARGAGGRRGASGYGRAVRILLVEDEVPLAEMVRRGLDARRLHFAKSRPNFEYLALYRVADLFLDTWPYNAHTTASDALWAGCPVLTCRGETFASRVAASLVTAVGLPELVCDSVMAYVGKAIALARDPGERDRLRAHLDGPGRASPLFDTVATTRALEAAYLAMADQYRRGVREPIHIAVEDVLSRSVGE